LSGVETRDFSGSMNRGPRAPEWGHKNVQNDTLAQYTQGFQQQKRSCENYHKRNFTLGGWGRTPLGEITPLCRPGEQALPKTPNPAVSTSGFQLQPLGPKQLRAPQVTVEPGPARALLRH